MMYVLTDRLHTFPNCTRAGTDGDELTLFGESGVIGQFPFSLVRFWGDVLSKELKAERDGNPLVCEKCAKADPSTIPCRQCGKDFGDEMKPAYLAGLCPPCYSGGTGLAVYPKGFKQNPPGSKPAIWSEEEIQAELDMLPDTVGCSDCDVLVQKRVTVLYRGTSTNRIVCPVCHNKRRRGESKPAEMEACGVCGSMVRRIGLYVEEIQGSGIMGAIFRCPSCQAKTKAGGA